MFNRYAIRDDVGNAMLHHDRFKNETYAESLTNPDRLRREKNHRNSIQRQLNRKSFSDIVKGSVDGEMLRQAASAAVEHIVSEYIQFRERCLIDPDDEIDEVENDTDDNNIDLEQEQVILEMFLEKYDDRSIQIILNTFKTAGMDIAKEIVSKRKRERG
jgi:hypothetical protein